LASGVVTFGDAPPPVPLYEGPTDRRHVKKPPTHKGVDGLSSVKSPGSSGDSPGEEGDSLGNANRGERIRTSDLTVPNRAL
jgi:hypothetical protein